MPRWGLATLVLALNTFFVAHTAAATMKPTLVVAPSEGHPGNTFYLSAAGFPAHRQLAVSLICPSGGKEMRLSMSSEPTTDARGQLVARSFPTPRLSGGTSSRCSLNARTVLGAAASASTHYTIVSAKQPLSRCARQICLKVKALVVRTRHGSEGSILVQGWPGAQVQVTILPPHGKTLSRHLQLGWQGADTVRIPLGSTAKKGLSDRVQVTAHLGSASGSAQASFVTLPNT